MTSIDRPKFLTLLTSLAEMFGKPLSDSAVALYFEALKDLPIEGVERAAGRIARSATFMPRPVDFRENSSEVIGTAKDRALDAWRLVCKHASRYSSADIHDPALAATIEAMGGWVELHSDDRETHWIEKDFLRWYEHFAVQQIPPSTTHFMGLQEASNLEFNNAPRFPCVEIGTPARQRLTE